jgi:hypothetical protein
MSSEVQQVVELAQHSGIFAQIGHFFTDQAHAMSEAVKALHTVGEFIAKTPILNIFHDSNAKLVNFFTHAPSIPGMEVSPSNNPFGFDFNFLTKSLKQVADNNLIPHINFGDRLRNLFDGGKAISEKFQPLAQALFKQEVFTNLADVASAAGITHGVGTGVAAGLGHKPSQAVFTRPINAIRSFAGVGAV